VNIYNLNNKMNNTEKKKKKKKKKIKNHNKYVQLNLQHPNNHYSLLSLFN